jgi:hypothetical protein
VAADVVEVGWTDHAGLGCTRLRYIRPRRVSLVIDCAEAEAGSLELVAGRSGAVVRLLASHTRTCPFPVGYMGARRSGAIGDAAAHCTLRKDLARVVADCGVQVEHWECVIEVEATVPGMVAGTAVEVVEEDSLPVLGYLCVGQYIDLNLVRVEPTWCVVAIRWSAATIAIRRLAGSAVLLRALCHRCLQHRLVVSSRLDKFLVELLEVI